MAKTRAQFVTYVKLDFKRTDKDTEIIQAYNDTLVHLSNLAPFEGLKFQSWINTVAGQEDVPLPNDKCHVIHPLRFIESATDTNGYPMNKRSKQEWSEMYPNPNATGTAVSRARPTDYCLYSNCVLLGPLPDKATYIIEMDWSKLVTEKAADSDLHELGAEWDEVLKFGTLARLYEGLGLSQEADRYWGLYADDRIGYPLLVRKDEDQTQKMGFVKFRDL